MAVVLAVEEVAVVVAVVVTVVVAVLKDCGVLLFLMKVTLITKSA